MFGPFKPAPHIAELPAEKIDSTYKRLRWQVFAGIFFLVTPLIISSVQTSI